MAHLKKVYHQMQMGQTPFSLSLEGTTYLGKSNKCYYIMKGFVYGP